MKLLCAAVPRSLGKHSLGDIVSLRHLSSGVQRASNSESEYDVAVVGGGIVGCATARELKMRHPKLRMCLIEKEKHFAGHQSGHNSGVIHAGIYYTPGSLKAKLCVEGMRLAYKYCDEHNIPYKKVGKLIVARDDVEVERLHVLHDKGLKNEVPDLELISSSKITQLEPYVRGKEALLSPHTGIVDWGLVTKSFAESFEKLGGDTRLNFEVSGFEMTEKNLVRIRSKDGAVRCRFALTCGGLHADRLAEMSGCGREPRIVPFRGEYLLLKPEKRNLIQRNVYPVPDPRFPFLGVHFTPRMDGAVWLGPNAVLALSREGYSWSDFDAKDLWDAVKFSGFQKLAVKYIGFGTKEIMRSWVMRLQVRELQKFVPALSLSDVTRGPAGVRAQAMDGSGNLVDDFVFDTGKEGDIGKRVLHCRNAPSPGATSSLAIAKMIADKVESAFSL
ncbi:unnamed protein product [Notodromas monacha]|uniref:L-2-hydroxyglutarate dehydrogenase, mitochondrial n=1 Tax=Notodromas monacha TaxID=399045 RepID=A0A7R9BGA0_9CRUS|nr:unnamed protein product [Notodromas monacha]CAG0914926.1 unnamed protein product [Notodromas monacha]